MPSIKTSEINLFRRRVQSLLKAYSDSDEYNENSIWRWNKLDIISALEKNTLVGVDFLNFFKIKIAQLHPNSQLKKTLLNLLPDLIELEDATQRPDDMAGWYTLFSMLLETPRCPLTRDKTAEPVLANDGYVYDKKALDKYMAFQVTNNPYPFIMSPVVPQIKLDNRLFINAPMCAGVPDSVLPNAGNSKPYDPQSRILTYIFSNQEKIEKIQIGENFINLYQSHQLCPNDDWLYSKIFKNFEKNNSIAKLSGRHEKYDEHGKLDRQFSICVDHGNHAHDNAIYEQDNQESEYNHFHEGKRGGNHIHLVYRWDGVFLSDINALFSYIQSVDSEAVSQKDFVTLVECYLKFMAQKICKILSDSDNNEAVKSVSRFFKEVIGCSSIFTSENQLQSQIVTVLPTPEIMSVLARNTMKNDRLYHTTRMLVSELRNCSTILTLDSRRFTDNPNASKPAEFLSRFILTLSRLFVYLIILDRLMNLIGTPSYRHLVPINFTRSNTSRSHWAIFHALPPTDFSKKNMSMAHFSDDNNTGCASLLKNCPSN